MNYQNRKIPEGINVSSEHPLKEFAILALIAVALVVLVVVILSALAEHFVKYIPFKAEQAIAATMAKQLDDGEAKSPEQQEIQDYLQGLANTLAVNQRLPKGMTITVHYIDESVVNAFATAGGHIVMYKGLLQEMPHENALSMVMAHEIAHVKHRDPLVSLGRGLTVLLAMASVAGVSDSSLFERFLGQAGLLTTLSFSRQQEKAADLEAYSTLREYYGHLQGAEALFEVLKSQEGSTKTPAFFTTHPLTSDRIETTKAFAASIHPLEKVELKKLPDFIERLK
ncbi:MAG: M48 family metallopeptidase [Methylococcales bacterium]